jgi:predicted MFS family arabinose efflux permease
MNPWRGLRELPRQIWILFAATLVNRCGTMVLPFLVLYLTRELKISVSHAALALTIYGVAALLTMPVSGWVTDRLGSLIVMRASLLLSGLALFLFPLAHHFVAILFITFAFAILNESCGHRASRWCPIW